MEKVNTLPGLRFPDFEDDWTLKRFSDLLRTARLGGNYANTLMKTKYPLIKMGNLKRGNVDISKLEYIPESEIINCDHKLKFGDLLFNTRNTLELVGKVAIWKGELREAYFNSNVMNLQFDDNFFMNYRLNSYQGIRLLKSLATGTTSVAAIYNKDLVKIKLLVPSLPEQQKIAAFLTAVDDKIQQLQKKKDLLERYKKGVMQRIFNQEIRFKDDEGNEYPDWEEKKLGNVCEITKGVQLNVKDMVSDGAYPALNGGIDPSGFINQWNTEAGTITISEGGNSCGFVNYSQRRFWCGGHCYALKQLNGVSVQFLYQALKYSQLQIMNLRVGSGLPNIQKKSLLSFTIIVPSSSEQTKIGHLLSKIDIKISTIQKQLRQTKQFKKGLLQKMFV